jgi:hypothetical protein
MTLSDLVQLIFPANGNPILCRKHRWFEEGPWALRGKSAPDIFKPLSPATTVVVVQGGETCSLGDATGSAGNGADRRKTYDKGSPDSRAPTGGLAGGSQD